MRLGDQERRLVYVLIVSPGPPTPFDNSSPQKRTFFMSSIGSSIDSLQHSPRDHRPSFESRDEPANLRSGEIQNLPARQQPPLDTVDLACSGSPLSSPDSPIYPSTDSPSWKRLINTPFAAHERTSLIATMFSKRDEVEATRHIGGDDAQIFVDMIYEVRSHSLMPPKCDPADSVCFLSVRRWTALTMRHG